MNNSLYRLLRELDDIRSFIATTEMHKNLLSYRSSQTNPRRYKRIERVVISMQRQYESFTSKRLFDYKTIVISLYGALERFLEDLIKEYLILLSEVIQDYTKLPGKIKSSHIQLSADLLKRLDQQKYQHVSENEIITNLNLCMNDSANFKLNVDAYTYHTYNFKHDTINNFFSAIDINNISNKVQTIIEFQEYLQLQYPEGVTALQAQKEIEEKLNDLAQRRNEVAHGSECEILSNEILLTYLDFMEAYCKSINELIYTESIPHQVQHRSIPLNKPKYIHDNRIICLLLDNTNISVGDTIFAKSSDGISYTYGEIKEIQINRKTYPAVSGREGLEVGMRVDFYVKDNQEFYLSSNLVRIENGETIVQETG